MRPRQLLLWLAATLCPCGCVQPTIFAASAARRLPESYASCDGKDIGDACAVVRQEPLMRYEGTCRDDFLVGRRMCLAQLDGVAVPDAFYAGNFDATLTTASGTWVAMTHPAEYRLDIAWGDESRNRGGVLLLPVDVAENGELYALLEGFVPDPMCRAERRIFEGPVAAGYVTVRDDERYLGALFSLPPITPGEEERALVGLRVGCAGQQALAYWVWKKAMTIPQVARCVARNSS